MNLWLLLVLEPSVVNPLSLLKAKGEVEATVGLEPDREVKFVNFMTDSELWNLRIVAIGQQFLMEIMYNSSKMTSTKIRTK